MNVTTGGVTGVRRRVVEEARERGVLPELEVIDSPTLGATIK
jgi:hypothetical protein